MANLWGVDYGKKLSGNTVVCKKQAMSVRFFQAEKRQDADAFLLDLMWQESPEQIFIDAPLSLPGVYCDGKNYDNYFFRRCDQQLGAMSPMFLGGVNCAGHELKGSGRGTGGTTKGDLSQRFSGTNAAEGIWIPAQPEIH